MLPVEVADPGMALEDNSCVKTGTDAPRGGAYPCVSVGQLAPGVQGLTWIIGWELVTFCSRQVDSVS